MKVSPRANPAISQAVLFCFTWNCFSFHCALHLQVPGLLRKNNYGERFDRLMDHATTIFNTLLDRAAKIPRNYIIDQTNVYKSARIRKMRPFANYRKVSF
jgi:hypothetical protein